MESGSAGRAHEAFDDRGTDNQQALSILRTLRDQAFDGDNDKLGLALGRPLNQIEAWMNGEERVDDDIVMKARGIAQERNVEI
jgi:hypothetical protein